MKKFKNHQRPRRKYRFDIVGHKKALKIWWDSPFNIVPGPVIWFGHVVFTSATKRGVYFDPGF